MKGVFSPAECEPGRKGGGAATADYVLPATGTGTAPRGGVCRCGVSGERTAHPALHRSGAVPAHEAQRTGGMAQKLTEVFTRARAAEKGGRSREATAIDAKATGTGRGEAEEPTALAS